jgi:hypothetical protein
MSGAVAAMAGWGHWPAGLISFGLFAFFEAGFRRIVLSSQAPTGH